MTFGHDHGNNLCAGSSGFGRARPGEGDRLSADQSAEKSIPQLRGAAPRSSLTGILVRPVPHGRSEIGFAGARGRRTLRVSPTLILDGGRSHVDAT